MKNTRISTSKIAEICGVSQGTVDRALNNRKGISPKTKEKILKIAKEYGYRPNIHASSIAGGKSQIIGVVVFDLNNPYFSDVLMNVEGYCTSLGYSTVVMFTDKDYEKEIRCIENLYHMSVDGIILCPVNSGIEYENYLLSLNIPIVTIGNKLSGIPYIGIDNKLAIKDVVMSLQEKGYKKLIYIKPNLVQRNTFAQTERLDSFSTNCEKVKMDFVITDMDHVEKELSINNSCALVCPTDIYAIKLLRVTQKYKAGIIGFDNLRLIDELELQLDSISYDIALTAQKAVNNIVNKTPITDSIPHKIIKRGSV